MNSNSGYEFGLLTTKYKIYLIIQTMSTNAELFYLSTEMPTGKT